MLAQVETHRVSVPEHRVEAAAMVKGYAFLPLTWLLGGQLSSAAVAGTRGDFSHDSETIFAHTRALGRAVIGRSQRIVHESDTDR